jgi:hypothetical protein
MTDGLGRIATPVETDVPMKSNRAGKGGWVGADYRRPRPDRAGLATKQGSSVHSAGTAGQMTIDGSDCMRTAVGCVMAEGT